MWPQVTQYIVGKDKRKGKYVPISKARSSYMARLMPHHYVLGISWFGHAAVLCVTLQA